MIGGFPSIDSHRPNPDWAKLPLFDRKGWRRMPFGAFADSINERVEPIDAAEEIYVGLEHLDSQNLHIRRWGKGSDVIGTKLRFRKGDIIFGRRRAYQRKLAVAEFDGICSAHAMVVRAKPDVVLPEFLPFLMMSDRFMNRAVEISVGSLSPTINWKTLKLEEFTFPPLDQQHHIAEVLWGVDEVHCEYAETGNAAETLFSAGVNHHFGGAHYPATKGSKQVNLGEVADVRLSGVDKKTRSDEEPVRLCNYLDVYRNRYISEAMPFMEASARQSELMRFELTSGDLLITKDSEEPSDIAVPALVTSDLRGVLCGYHLALVRGNKDLVDPKYLLFLFRSNHASMYFSSRAKGITRFGLGLDDIREFQFRLPPVDEQIEIADELSAYERTAKHLKEHSGKMEATMLTLLTSLIGGQQ